MKNTISWLISYESGINTLYAMNEPEKQSVLINELQGSIIAHNEAHFTQRVTLTDMHNYACEKLASYSVPMNVRIAYDF